MNCAKGGCKRPVKKGTNYCEDHQPEDRWVMRQTYNFGLGRKSDGSLDERATERRDEKDEDKDRR